VGGLITPPRDSPLLFVPYVYSITGAILVILYPHNHLIEVSDLRPSSPDCGAAGAVILFLDVE